MIFNAVIIILLIPLALRGVKFRPAPAVAVLRRNLLINGLTASSVARATQPAESLIFDGLRLRVIQ